MTDDEQLTADQVADLLGIKPATWRAYVWRDGRAPLPDGRHGARLNWWWRSTVTAWDAAGRPKRDG